MSRNSSVSKEDKVKACKYYQTGQGSNESIAKDIGVNATTVREWYYRYSYHGSSAFDTSNSNKGHSKPFKTSLVELFISGDCSALELSGKYNLSLGMVNQWIKKYNKGIELKDYDPKGEVYTMKSRKTTYEERLEIVKWVIENNFNDKDAAEKYGIKYAAIYQWVKKYLTHNEASLEYKKRGPKESNKINESELDDIGKLKLELERERILRKQAEFRLELLKKKRGVREKNTFTKVRNETDYLTVDYYRKHGYSVKMLCDELDISRSAYYKHEVRLPPEKEAQDELLCCLINEYHATFDGILGYRRMTVFINRLNQTTYSEKYIHRLMKQMKITARIRRKKVNRKRVKPDYVKDNVLSRDFTANMPNEKWLTDVTEFSIPCDSRKLFLSPIMDLYDNSIVEYELSFSNNNILVFKMFDRAVHNNPTAKPIVHSDRGFQYTNNKFKSKIDDAGMIQSMSRVGKCIDNGPMEGFFGALKTEMFYGKKFHSMEYLIAKIKAYITFYNEKRFQKRLKCLAPMEYRNQALNIA